MRLTRQHFELIAETLAEVRGYDITGEAMLDVLGQHFANKLAGTNPNFDVNKFLSACKGEA